MKNQLRRGLSFLLSLVMTLTLVMIPAYAIPADPVVQFDQSIYTVTQNASDQQVTITLQATSAFSCNATGGTITSLGGMTLNDVLDENGTSMWGGDYTVATQMWSHMPDPVNADNTNITNIVSLVVTVPGGTAAGDYSIVIDDLVLGWWNDTAVDQEGYGVAEHWVATIRVQEPTSQPDWEIYYTLDQSTDTDTDKYIEYNPGDTVVATVYMKAKAADHLQAFDFTVTNDANLEYKSYTSTYGTRIESGTAQSTATSQHIQAVGYDKASNPIDQAMAANTGVAIATITYQVKNSAVYDTDMPITITAADFAVQNNPASFTPEIQSYSSDTLGVETLKTWTVTYYDDSAAMTVPAAETVGHGLTATQPADPTKDGWTFDGWYQEIGLTNAFNFSTPITADTPVYSKWTQQEYHVNWHWGYDTENNQYDDTKVYSDPTVYHYNDTATYGGSDTPVKPSTAEKNFTFIGWNTSDTATSALAAPLTITGNTDFYAIFSESDRTYEVTFDLQGHGAAVSAQNVVYNGTVTEPDPAPADTNYDFGGWYKEAGCTNAWNFATDTITAEGVVLYAKWTPKTFTLNLIENDGTYVSPYIEPTTYTYGAQDALPTAVQIEKTGYTFGGWYADSGFTGSAVTNVPEAATGEQTFYAKWTPITYTVRFNRNGGTGGANMADQSFTYDVAQNLTANTFTKTVGTTTYKFKGWTTVADPAEDAAIDYTDGENVNNLTTTANAVVNLYAVWVQADFSITYVLGDGASNGAGNPTTYNIDGLPITLTDPSRPGYTFTGWTATKTGSDPAEVVALTGGNQIPAGTTGDLTITAAWNTVAYEITFVEDGGSAVGTNHKLSYNIESTATLPVTTKTGYTFQHWLLTDVGAVVQNWGTANTSTAAEGASVNGKYGNVELTAVWQAKTAQLSFNPVQDADHVGTLDPNNPIDVTYDGTYPSLPTPVPPTGYDFDGWYIGSDKIQTGDTVAIDEDTTAVAHYTAHVYNITFDEAGGADVSDLTYTIESTSVTIPSTSKDYYDFGGWSVTSSVSFPSGPIAAGALALSGNYGDVILTAIWTPKTYGVTLNENGGSYVAPYTEPTSYTYGSGLTLPVAAEITKDGYTFGGWYDNSGLTGTAVTEITATDNGAKEYWAKWTANPYTITLALAGGSVTGSTTINYTTDTGFTLPTPTKANYQFDTWKVTANDAGDGTLWGPVNTTTWNAGTYTNDADTRYYGNVTLTAQYNVSLKYGLQTYKYAPTGYKLLVVNAAGAGDGVYTYSGDIMYYTTDTYYQIEIDSTTHAKSTGVFYTIVKESTFSVDNIVPGDGTKTGIADVKYDDNSAWVNGDINGDKVVNIADANAIFQMVVNGGSYYSFDQLSILARLRADMDTDTTGQTEEYRGSIADVNAIVSIINGDD